MKKYAYAIVHDGNKCLVFRKNGKSLFSKREVSLPKAKDIKDGPGSYCFPGGKMGNVELPLSLAVRKFKEETGVDLLVYDAMETRVIPSEKFDCFGIFLKVSVKDFDEIRDKCMENLLIVSTLTITYAVVPNIAIFSKLPENLQDNELSSDVQDLTFDDAKGQFLETSMDSSWFIDLINLFDEPRTE